MTMKRLYTASLLAASLAFPGCAQNAYVQKDMAERSKGPGTVICTPMKGLVDDTGFSCNDQQSNAMRIHPDKRVWKDSYESMRSILDQYSEKGTTIEATGEYDVGAAIMEADIIDLRDAGMLVFGKLYPTHKGTLDTLVDGEPRVVTCNAIAGLVTEDNFACRDESGAQRTFAPSKNKLKVWDRTFEKQRGGISTEEPLRVAGTYDAKDNVFRFVAYDQGGKKVIVR